jgi:hypothetical protein
MTKGKKGIGCSDAVRVRYSRGIFKTNTRAARLQSSKKRPVNKTDEDAARTWSQMARQNAGIRISLSCEISIIDYINLAMSVDTRLFHQSEPITPGEDAGNNSDEGDDFGALYGVGDEGEFHSHSGNELIVEDDGDLNWEDILLHR